MKQKSDDLRWHSKDECTRGHNGEITGTQNDKCQLNSQECLSGCRIIRSDQRLDKLKSGKVIPC